MPIPEETKNIGQKYWPELPAQPRFMHEGSLGYTNDIQPKNQAFKLEAIVTGATENSSAFIRPYDVIARHGRIYISDTDAGIVNVYDLPRHRYYRIGRRIEGKLAKPMGLTLDDQSTLYVTDIGSRSIKVFDFLGMHLRTFRLNKNLQQLMSVAVDGKAGRIYVVDNGGIDNNLHRILVYDRQDKLIQTIGKRGHETGEFNLPTDAIVGRDGALYVLDSGNFRVQAFNVDGKFINSWGAPGSSFDQFGRPRSISIDSSDNLYVTDMFFGNVQIFNPQGQLLLPIGQLHELDKLGHYRLISGIAVDETQRVYVVDQFFKKVDIYRWETKATPANKLEPAWNVTTTITSSTSLCCQISSSAKT